MQIASFILVNDSLLRQFAEQLEEVVQQLPSTTSIFLNVVPARLQALGREHPISIPFGSLLPLDQAAERQHAHIISAFEDPRHPSRLGKMALASNSPIYYISPPRVRDFAQELELLRLAEQIRPEDVESLLGRHISSQEMPGITRIVEQFRHDLYQVYHDAAEQGKGVIVLVSNQPEEMGAEGGFPRAA